MYTYVNTLYAFLLYVMIYRRNLMRCHLALGRYSLSVYFLCAKQTQLASSKRCSLAVCIQHLLALGRILQARLHLALAELLQARHHLVFGRILEVERYIMCLCMHVYNNDTDTVRSDKLSFSKRSCKSKGIHNMYADLHVYVCMNACSGYMQLTFGSDTSHTPTHGGTTSKNKVLNYV